MIVQVQQALESDWLDIHSVVVEAFGCGQGRELAGLIADLLKDKSAAPQLSLVATVSNTLAGHILFTNAHLKNSRRKISASILAPLSVRPRYQGQGIGGQLISEGINQLRTAGFDLVFVLGHPKYYSRHGFTPAGVKGLVAPHPIPPENADAWMVQELHPRLTDAVSGQVRCAETLNNPKYWQE